jgi:hypothetical protein
MSNTQQLTMIITAYRAVCQQTPTTAGLTSANYQQWRTLTKLGQVSPNPRKAFLQDLGLLIDNIKLILQLDANTVFNKQEWNNFLESQHCFGRTSWGNLD